MSLPRPSLSTLFSSCLLATKSTLSNCLATIQEKRAESTRLSQDPRNLKRGKSTELSDFGTFDKEEEFDEFGGVVGDKITEWQAGWNVTNAIQVWFFCCHGLTRTLFLWKLHESLVKMLSWQGQFPRKYFLDNLFLLCIIRCHDSNSIKFI